MLRCRYIVITSLYLYISDSDFLAAVTTVATEYVAHLSTLHPIISRTTSDDAAGTLRRLLLSRNVMSRLSRVVLLLYSFPSLLLPLPDFPLFHSPRQAYTTYTMPRSGDKHLLKILISSATWRSAVGEP